MNTVHSEYIQNITGTSAYINMSDCQVFEVQQRGWLTFENRGRGIYTILKSIKRKYILF